MQRSPLSEPMSSDINGNIIQLSSNVSIPQSHDITTPRGSDVENRWEILRNRQNQEKNGNKKTKMWSKTKPKGDDDEDSSIVSVSDIALQSEHSTSGSKSNKSIALKSANNTPSKPYNANEPRSNSLPQLNRSQSLLQTIQASINKHRRNTYDNKPYPRPNKQKQIPKTPPINMKRQRSMSYSVRGAPTTPDPQKEDLKRSSTHSEPIKFKRRVSFADTHGSPLKQINRMNSWYHERSLPSRGRYKPIRRRSHTLPHSQFSLPDTSSSSLDENDNGTHSHSSSAKSLQRRASLTSLNAPQRQKIRRSISRQLSIDIPPMKRKKSRSKSRSKSKSKRRKSKNKRSKSKNHDEPSCIACIIL